MLAWIFGDCREDQRPAACSGVFDWLSETFEEIAEKIQSKELISTWRSRLVAVRPENYCQQNFQSKEMRQYVDYSEYVRSIEQEIDYAEGRIVEQFSTRDVSK